MCLSTSVILLEDHKQNLGQLYLIKTTHLTPPLTKSSDNLICLNLMLIIVEIVLKIL